jgi:hypothetical protein
MRGFILLILPNGKRMLLQMVPSVTDLTANSTSVGASAAGRQGLGFIGYSSFSVSMTAHRRCLSGRCSGLSQIALAVCFGVPFEESQPIGFLYADNAADPHNAQTALLSPTINSSATCLANLADLIQCVESFNWFRVCGHCCPRIGAFDRIFYRSVSLPPVKTTETALLPGGHPLPAGSAVQDLKRVRWSWLRRAGQQFHQPGAFLRLQLPYPGQRLQVHALLDLASDPMPQHVHRERVQFHAAVAMLGDKSGAARIGAFGRVGRQVVALDVLGGQGALDNFWTKPRKTPAARADCAPCPRRWGRSRRSRARSHCRHRHSDQRHCGYSPNHRNHGPR